MSAALEDRRIQIQTEALGRCAKHRHNPDPERAPERLDLSLGKTGEEVADRIGAGKTADPQHRVQCLVGAQPVSMRKAARPDHHGKQECHQCLCRRNGSGATKLEWHRFLNLLGKADPVEKLDQADQSPERGDGLGRATELNLAGTENRVKL